MRNKQDKSEAKIRSAKKRTKAKNNNELDDVKCMQNELNNKKRQYSKYERSGSPFKKINNEITQT